MAPVDFDAGTLGANGRARNCQSGDAAFAIGECAFGKPALDSPAMNPARVDFVTLRLFCAVAQTGSITKGASRCHLALSAASRRLTDFEEAVGLDPARAHRPGRALDAGRSRRAAARDAAVAGLRPVRRRAGRIRAGLPRPRAAVGQHVRAHRVPARRAGQLHGRASRHQGRDRGAAERRHRARAGRRRGRHRRLRRRHAGRRLERARCSRPTSWC